MEDTRAWPTTPLPEGWVRIKGPTDFPEFEGELISISLGDSDSQYTHWTDLALYRKTDGSGNYVLQTVARSVVYHAINGCERGVTVSIGTLVKRFLGPDCTEPTPEPCELCAPIDIHDCGEGGIVPGVSVRMEVDWYHVSLCRDEHELLNRLRDKKRTTINEFSKPARNLLDAAKEVDSRIRDALSQPRRI